MHDDMNFGDTPNFEYLGLVRVTLLVWVAIIFHHEGLGHFPGWGICFP